MIYKRYLSIFFVAAMLFCLCTLCACGQNSGTPTPAPPPVIDEVAPTDAPKPSNPDETLIREDEDGLVQVSIKNGGASISFDLERWNGLYGLYDMAREYYYVPNFKEATSGVFPITGLSGKVKDACIGKISSLDFLEYGEFVMPAIILLMEDGRLEWLLADIFAPTFYEGMIPFESYRSMGQLPWIEGITKLAYETDTDGIGEMTVFAEDAEGQRYDLRLPCRLINFFNGTWRGELIPADHQDAIYGYMRFSDDGSMAYNVGNEGETLEMWQGSFKMYLAEGQVARAGTIEFDLALDWWVYEPEDWDSEGVERTTQTIQAGYLVDIDRDGRLSLYLSWGDMLYQFKQEPQIYTFWLVFDEATQG